jgi:DNA-binding GntR family transcriptional regulator
MVGFIPEKGMFVTPIRFEDMIEIYELREALEGMAIKLCVLRKTDDLIKQMEECISVQEMAYKQGQSSLCVEKDLEFHNLFIKGAKNNRLENLLKTVRDQNYRMALFTTTDHNRLEMSIEQHRKVLAAVKQGDENKAEALVKEHIVNVKEYHVKKQYSAMI